MKAARAGQVTSSLVVIWISSWAVAAPSYSNGMNEEETARVSKLLRPIPDEEWNQIAGPRTSETYEVTKGDTLSDVSKRMFGDPKYWPKIWALNNSGITNPHRIEPHNHIAFMPGSGNSLPSVAIQKTNGTYIAANTANQNNNSVNPARGAYQPPEAQDFYKGGVIPRTPGRSQEWRRLNRQKWESVDIQLPPDVDPQGFSKNNKIIFKLHTGFDLQAIATTSSLQSIGKVVGSRSNAFELGGGDLIYIEPSGNGEVPLETEKTYLMVTEDQSITGSVTGRTGHGYAVYGRVRLIAERDGLFLGFITNARHPISRGVALIPDIPKIQNVAPVPGPSPIEASMIVNVTETKTTVFAQFDTVYIDRGSEDGIQPGMVFRAYNYKDPNTDKTVTSANFLVEGDFLVVNVTPEFSTGIMISGRGHLETQTKAVLLTDVSSISARLGVQNRTADELKRNTELDQLDKNSPDQLSPDEERELLQLEKWDDTSPEKTPFSPDEALPEAPIEGAGPETTPLPDSPSDIPVEGGEVPVTGDEIPLEGGEIPAPPTEGEVPMTPAPDAGALPVEDLPIETAP
ncbi:LysM peptidoglycan-binding domain-containing protein [bacterium]|nr:LysM peptidoglycan-binding domain-containing protein [bacterium]